MWDHTTYPSTFLTCICNMTCLVPVLLVEPLCEPPGEPHGLPLHHQEPLLPHLLHDELLLVHRVLAIGDFWSGSQDKAAIK